jgi:hypothetical protein
LILPKNQSGLASIQEFVIYILNITEVATSAKDVIKRSVTYGEYKRLVREYAASIQYDNIYPFIIPYTDKEGYFYLEKCQDLYAD